MGDVVERPPGENGCFIVSSERKLSYRMALASKNPHRRSENTDAPHFALPADVAEDVHNGSLNVVSSWYIHVRKGSGKNLSEHGPEAPELICVQ